MLRPRILHFAKEQIFWKCLSLTACESSPSSLPVGVYGADTKLELKWRRALHQDRLTNLDTADLSAIWQHIVHSYTSCNLTLSGDKLIALSGIATAMQRGLDEKSPRGSLGRHDGAGQAAGRPWRPALLDCKDRQENRRQSLCPA